MVVDYSKWDKLELSDDSDIEVHPNVDKKSFIRWKQRDIHEKRQQRQGEIEYLKSEQVMNTNLLTRIDNLCKFLEEIKDSEDGNSRNSADAILDNACSVDAKSAPAGKSPNENSSYEDMMKSLVDQVKAAASKKIDLPYIPALIEELKDHHEKLIDAQNLASKKLNELLEEEAKHITSDDLKIGFDSTRVNKKISRPVSSSNNSPTKSDKGKQKVQEIEVLNHPPVSGESSTGASSTDEDPTEEDIQASEIGKQFASIKIGSYEKCLEFIATHPEIISEKESDGILMEAFTLEMQGEHVAAKRYVHNALLLQYCHRLGRDGVTVFFRKIMSPNHPALDAFLKDVEQTYAHVKNRSQVLLKEQQERGEVEEEEIINLDELNEEQLAQYGLTKADLDRFRQEQAEQDAVEEEGTTTIKD
ncbi:Cdc37 N terminal kinase binding-domain-containing protein [Dipodascopsis uninucleata]